MKVAKKIVNTGSLLLAGAMLLSVFPVMTLAKPLLKSSLMPEQVEERMSILG